MEERQQILDIQVREGKDGFLGMVFGHYSRMSFMISSGQMKSGDIFYMTNFIIGMIPDRKKVNEIKAQLKERMKEVIEEKKAEGYSESAAKEVAIFTACTDMILEISIFIDEHLGVSKANRIGLDLDCNNCEFKKQSEKK